MRSPRRKAPSVPASLQRSASASNRRFSLPENWRRLAIATTSGSRRAAASEAVSPVALRAPSATASEEEPNDPFIEDFSNEVMCMSYLYSKLPETGVSPHIGTGGCYLKMSAKFTLRPRSRRRYNLLRSPLDQSVHSYLKIFCSQFRQHPGRKYDPVNIQIRSITSVAEEHGSDYGKRNKVCVENR